MANHTKDTFPEIAVPQDRGADLEQEMFANDYRRKERFKSHFALILIFFLYLASSIVAVMVFCWAYHFFSPNNWYFLSNERVSEIQSMLFAGLVSQAIPYMSSYLKKQG
jgi:hypothetical protein